MLEDAPDWLDGQARARVEGAIGGLAWRVQTLQAWIALTARIGGPADPDFVDWLAVERVEGREYDAGLHRHWLDPTRPLADAVLKPAHGVLVTSATLRGGEDWAQRRGAHRRRHLGRAAQRFETPSPFDYAANSEVLVVTDVKKRRSRRARRRLCAADRGGGRRHARPVHRDPAAEGGTCSNRRPARPRRPAALRPACRSDRHRHARGHLPRRSARRLLGTDALRDGVDVPGHSLRLVVMEGVPWPRPTVLHAARRASGGGSAYDDRRRARAIGAGVRPADPRADDRGLFVLLSAATPSRLLTAFPPGVRVSRVHLADAIDRVGCASHPHLDAVLDPELRMETNCLTATTVFTEGTALSFILNSER